MTYSYSRVPSVVIFLAVAVGLIGCGLPGPAPLPTPEDQRDPDGFLAAVAREGFDPLNTVIIGERAWAVREGRRGTLTISSFTRIDGRIAPEGTAAEQGQPGAAETSAMMSASNGSSWTVFAGRVAADVAWVQPVGAMGEGGWVHRRLFVIALPDTLLRCEDIGWQMLDADGSVLREGRGLFGQPGC